MSDVSALPEREAFVGWVHDALNHLYDTRFLNRHPLADFLVGTMSDAVQRSRSLRRILVDAIRSLRPVPGTPAQSPDWRAHRILELRYIEGLTPVEVMDRLALSKSHYFREQARVVEAVADFLWIHAAALPVDEQNDLSEAHATNTTLASLDAPPGGSRSELAQAEVERLCSHAVWEEIDVAELLIKLRTVIESLAVANGVTLELSAAGSYLIAHGSRTLLRQSILNVVTYALDMAQGGALCIEPVNLGAETGFAVRAVRSGAETVPEKRRQGVGLEVARQLLEAMRGRLELEEGENDWQARLLWRAALGQTLLVVDDNRAFIDLIRRYLTGYTWQVLGAGSGQEARQLLADTRVDAMVLDVMMPEEDGWELLRALRTTEVTCDIPIIVCSVLNEPQLALMLGASAYLPKPVSPPALLRALSVQDANRALAH